MAIVSEYAKPPLGPLNRACSWTTSKRRWAVVMKKVFEIGERFREAALRRRSLAAGADIPNQCMEVI